MNEAGPVPASSSWGRQDFRDSRAQFDRGNIVRKRSGATFALRNHTDEIATHLSISAG
jgi:hypothetical protein